MLWVGTDTVERHRAAWILIVDDSTSSGKFYGSTWRALLMNW